jgi:uncharacterized protein YjbI with pentapeptide repeats
MANEDHIKVLHQVGDIWNAWRTAQPLIKPDLSGANLYGACLAGINLRDTTLRGADLRKANLNEACLFRADLSEANLSGANLIRANFGAANLARTNLSEANLGAANLGGATLAQANLGGADLRGANLTGAFYLMSANFREANLSGLNLSGANLGTNLRGANLSRVSLREAKLSEADFGGANLSAADLRGADLGGANLSAADLRGADLRYTNLVEADLTDANLTGCRVYGTSVWGLKLSKDTNQQNLVITGEDEPEITADNIEVAQFLYLLLHNEKIRDIIDTIGKKGVLLLGRFTDGRIAVLERLREELRKRGYVPMVFSFDRPETKDFTETVRLLAGLSYFVIVDITNPRSAPLELQAIIPECMVPCVPILQKGEEPFSMLSDLWIKHRAWVLDPIRYPSVDRLIEVLDAEIVDPARARFAELLARKAEGMKVKDI